MACVAVGGYTNAAGDVFTLAESWNGKRWTIEPTPNPAGALENGLSAVSCASATSCMAFGNYDHGTLAESWNGEGWAIEPIPSPAGATGASLTGLSCFSATACTAVGSYTNGDTFGSQPARITLAESWNGKRWTIEPTPTTAATVASLSAVSCTSASACIAVGIASNGPLVEAWNGKRWTIELAPKPIGSRSLSLNAVSCATASACTAVGGWFAEYSRTKHGTLAEFWNGKTWTLEATPNPTPSYGLPDGLTEVSCTSAIACSAIGGLEGRGDEGAFAESRNGKTWSIDHIPDPGEYLLSGLSCISATACTAVGSTYGLTIGESWNGKRWAVERTPNPIGADRSYLDAVSCPTATTCTAVGNYTTGGGTQLTLSESWNGETWAIEPGSFEGSLTGVSCTSATACVAVGGNNDTTLAFSETWNGKTWAIKTVPKPTGADQSYLIRVSCTSAAACTAVGSYDLSSTAGSGSSPKSLVEDWNGKVWAIEPVPNPTGAERANLSGVSCTLATACVAVGSDSNLNGTNYTTLVEVWNGKSWAIEPTPNPSASQDGLSDVSCTSTTACTAVGEYTNDTGNEDNDRTLAEAWNGTTWAIEPTPNPTGSQISDLYEVSCTSATACTAVGSNGNGVLAETWNGTTWAIEDTPTPPGSSLSDVSCTSATFCTAVGSSEGATLAEQLPAGP